jgi:integrase
VGVTVRQKPQGSGVWWIFIHRDGKRRARRVGTGKAGRQLAEAAAIKIRARLLDGDVSDLALASARPAAAVATFAQFAEEWCAWYPGVHAIRPGTMENHESFLRAHLLPFFGARPVTAITPDLVEDFIAAKRGLGGSVRRSGKGLADSSLSLGLITLSLILSRAVRRGLLQANPVDQADWRATPRADTVDPFTGPELRAILAAASPDIAGLLPVWMQGGFREGEVLALRWSDLDIEQGTARVARTWSRGRLGPTKTGATRIVSLWHPVAEATHEWQATPASRRMLAPVLKVTALDPEAFLFGAGGRPMAQSAVRWRWQQTLRRARVRYRAPEMLRHTWASTLLSRGAPLLYVQKQGGWRSAAVLLRHYSRWMPDARPDATPAQPRQREEG